MPASCSILCIVFLECGVDRTWNFQNILTKIEICLRIAHSIIDYTSIYFSKWGVPKMGDPKVMAFNTKIASFWMI